MHDFLSPQAHAHQEMLRDRRDNPLPIPDGLDPIVAARQANDMFASWATDVGAATSEIETSGVRLLRIDADDADPDRALLYFHGGAYVIGSADHVAKMLGHVGRRAGCPSFSVDYRLAPEHAFPAAIDDAVTAYRWLLDQGSRPGKIVVGGDSAGGGIALALAMAARDRGMPVPAGVVAISPWADLSCTNDGWARNAHTDMLLHEERLAVLAQAYLAGTEATEPLASPMYGDFDGLPPLYIQASGGETLLDDAFGVAEAAARAGVDVRLDVFPLMQHVFQYCAGVMPEADDAITRLANWTRLHTAG